MKRRRAAGPRAEIEIEVAWRVRKQPGAIVLLHRVALHTARSEGFRRGILSIAVVGRRAMATLHQQYMNIVGPTDVLTFDLGTDRKRLWIEGEIVVCPDVAESVVNHLRATPQRDQAVRSELALYVAHGVLHLAGYDDQSPGSFSRMHAREDLLLSQLSIRKAFVENID